MDIEAQLVAAGYSAADAKKLASGFKQGLQELGLTDLEGEPLEEAVPAVAEITKSSSQLDKILIKLGCRAALAQKHGPLIEAAMLEFDISDAKCSAMFLAQILHESSRLTAVKENLNYSEQGLLITFKKYFDRNSARKYARQPEKIANRVYANRMGNGPEESGDGWRFRGRGLIQITGRDNYTLCGNDLGKDLVKDPGYLETTEGAARSAGWYWNMRGLNKSARIGDIKTNTRLINGGLKGYDDRVSLYNKALPLFTAMIGKTA